MVRDAKKQNKVNKGRGFGEKQNKKQNFSKKETEQKQGLWRKKRRKGLRPPVSQSNLFPLHLHWLKRQSVTSFYPFFVCFHFLVRCRHGVFRRFHPIWPIQPESARICPSLSRDGTSREKKKKKMWQDAARCGTDARAAASLVRRRVGRGCGSSGTASVLPSLWPYGVFN